MKIYEIDDKGNIKKDEFKKFKEDDYNESEKVKNTFQLAFRNHFGKTKSLNNVNSETTINTISTMASRQDLLNSKQELKTQSLYENLRNNMNMTNIKDYISSKLEKYNEIN